MTDKIEFFTHGEWTAVYVNGKLEVVGDHYHAEEWMEDYLGVDHYYTDEFLLGSDGDEVANTVQEIEEYRAQKDRGVEEQIEAEKQAEIERLRARLAELES